MAPKVRTCLWFERDGERAAEFYVSLLPDSRLEGRFVREAGEAPLMMDFTLAGTPYQIINGGPAFRQTAAASIAVTTQDQAETDRLWSALCADGGSSSRCGWLEDRFGTSWQIVPEALPRLLRDDDRAASGRAFQAMLGMTRIDIAALQAAFDDR